LNRSFTSHLVFNGLKQEWKNRKEKGKEKRITFLFLDPLDTENQ
jgi:hypothetical protein